MQDTEGNDFVSGLSILGAPQVQSKPRLTDPGRRSG
jgi:hypothetical protein